MVGVCPHCSGISIERLEDEIGKENIEMCCIGECGGREDLVVGYINNDFFECETEEEFIEEAKAEL